MLFLDSTPGLTTKHVSFATGNAINETGPTVVLPTLFRVLDSAASGRQALKILSRPSATSFVALRVSNTIAECLTMKS